MITDVKEQKDFFSVPETVTNPDEFKTWFNETYVRKDKAAEDPTVKAKVSGGVLGSEMTNFYRTAKERGIEFDAEEKKAIAKNEDLFAIVLKKQEERLTGTYVNQIEELKKSQAQGSDEKIKDYETKFEKLNNDLKEAKSAWKKTAEELDNEKKEGAARLRANQVATLLNEAKKGLKLKQKMTEAEQIGWETKVEKSLKFDLNEKGDGIEVFNANGERLTSKTKAGDFLNATEALQQLADAMDLGEVNPHGGKKIIQQPVTTRTASNNVDVNQNIPTSQMYLKRGKPVPRS